MKITEQQLRKVVRKSILIEHSRKRLTENIKRVGLLNEVFDPILLEEAKKDTIRTLIVEAPQDMETLTVGEVLEKIQQLEKVQDERKALGDKVEMFEKASIQLVSMIDKSIAKYNEGGNPSDIKQKKIDALDKLKPKVQEIADKAKGMKKTLVDPDAKVTGPEIMNAVKEIGSNFKKIILKDAATLAGDLQLAGWDEVFEFAIEAMDGFSKIPGLNTLMSAAQDVATIGKWMGKGVKSLWNKLSGGDPPAEALDDLVDQVAQSPDTKTKTAPFMNLFNIDDKYQAMLEDKLELDFIQAFKEQLSTWADSGFKDMTLGDLKNNPPEGMDIDNALEKWIPKQGDTAGRTVSGGDE